MTVEKQNLQTQNYHIFIFILAKQKQVTKILDECDEKIQQYREELEDLDKEEE